MATLSDSNLREIEDKLVALQDRLCRVDRLLQEGDKEIDDDKVEVLIERLCVESLDEHAGILLALHRCVENATYGRARYLARVEALTLVTLLNRLLPGVVDQTLDNWDWAEIIEQLESGDDA